MSKPLNASFVRLMFQIESELCLIQGQGPWRRLFKPRLNEISLMPAALKVTGVKAKASNFNGTIVLTPRMDSKTTLATLSLNEWVCH